MHRKIVPLLLLLSLPTLASCKFVFLNSLPSTGSNAGSSNASPIVPAGVSIFDDFPSFSVSKHSNLTALGHQSLASTGEKHILVLPVYFTNTASFSSSELSTINSAYNGAASKTGWQSLQSFYETSSYGQLIIDATVLDPYCYSGTDADFQAYANKNGSPSATSYLAYLALRNLPANFDYSSYDQDQDGYLDGFEMVYKSTIEWDGKSSATEVWWNFTSFSTIGAGTAAKPNVGTFFWSQYSLLANHYYNPNIDCHTLIHETGHMLGLNDYYSYDNEGAPAGMADMMDFNIGDHNAYSKMVLGWVKPMVVDGTSNDFSLTLRSFTETGDCVILRNSENAWSETPYDEYLLLQYYTPTGLNEQDAQGYPEWNSIGALGNQGLYRKPGLQVFHIDSRLMNTVRTASKGYEYTSSLKNSMIAASNTPSQSVDVSATNNAGSIRTNSPFRLFQAIPANGGNIFYTSDSGYLNYLGYQKALFGLSSYGCGSTKFSFAKYASFFTKTTTFNDGSSLDYSFEVTAQNASTIDLHFTKK